jgi:hypothetical protein
LLHLFLFMVSTSNEASTKAIRSVGPAVQQVCCH